MLIGISIVRNEADIIELSVKHHIAQGIDCCLICDDDSSDGTRHSLRRLALFDPRIRWLGNSTGGFYQRQVINALAQDARRLGAEWILPFDADEFWYSPEGLSQALRRASEEMGEIAAISVEVVNFAQRRDQVRLEPHAVVRAQYRASVPIGSVTEASDLVRSGAISYIEMQYPEKLICPAKPDLQIEPGAHEVVGEVSKRHVTNIHCLHVPLRAKEILLNKVEQSARLDAASFPEWHGWHLRNFARQAMLGRIEDEWAANSQEGGFIDARRGRVHLVYDPALPNLLGPLVTA